MVVGYPPCEKTSKYTLQKPLSVAKEGTVEAPPLEALEVVAVLKQRLDMK